MARTGLRAVADQQKALRPARRNPSNELTSYSPHSCEQSPLRTCPPRFTQVPALQGLNFFKSYCGNPYHKNNPFMPQSQMNPTLDDSRDTCAALFPTAVQPPCPFGQGPVPSESEDADSIKDFRKAAAGGRGVPAAPAIRRDRSDRGSVSIGAPSRADQGLAQDLCICGGPAPRGRPGGR